MGYFTKQEFPACEQMGSRRGELPQMSMEKYEEYQAQNKATAIQSFP